MNTSTINQFLKDNQYLFTIYGVFGALSLYATNLGDNYTDYYLLNFAATCSLIIFSLMGILIITNAFQHENTMDILFIIFLVPFSFFTLIMLLFISNFFQSEFQFITGFVFLHPEIVFFESLKDRYRKKPLYLFITSVGLLFAVISVLYLSVKYMEGHVYNENNILPLVVYGGFILGSLYNVLLSFKIYISTKLAKRILPLK